MSTLQLHSQEEIRGITLLPETPYEEPMHMVQRNPGVVPGALGMNSKDENGGKVTLRDSRGGLRVRYQCARHKGQGTTWRSCAWTSERWVRGLWFVVHGWSKCMLLPRHSFSLALARVASTVNEFGDGITSWVSPCFAGTALFANICTIILNAFQRVVSFQIAPYKAFTRIP
ncbi:hypothetical protein PYCCODRAFT_58155 [Trametes coccinea BRFM310]|uniref:Uncharacterized protein n=1 Tax=Trametes coccinea (strain BRFM310) TaxID=1353009 RepID=A0A1Y2IU51_TRAC3|nr:hypothetical protein PYCCODRAFT_58155 [Trametes coccinea BRFM310]